LLVGVWYFRPTPVKPANPVAAIKSPQLYYSTVGSSRQGFLLPDSSYVLLESGSTLRLDSAYNSSSRNAQLNGTAYFKIRRDPTRPFEVKGNAYYVTVLGTAFRMTANGGNLEVWLESGKVKVEKEEKGQRSLLGYLLPSESLTIQPAAAAKPKTGAFAQASLNAWKAQELVFDNTPLPEVILQLEACYNIHIRIAGSTLQHEVFSGRFKNDALPAVLDVLCFTLNKQYEFTDSTNVLIK
jgi:ferric-dicitrate binding protein FerR (iron transport regulator)